MYAGLEPQTPPQYLELGDLPGRAIQSTPLPALTIEPPVQPRPSQEPSTAPLPETQRIQEHPIPPSPDRPPFPVPRPQSPGSTIQSIPLPELPIEPPVQEATSQEPPIAPTTPLPEKKRIQKPKTSTPDRRHLPQPPPLDTCAPRSVHMYSEIPDANRATGGQSNNEDGYEKPVSFLVSLRD